MYSLLENYGKNVTNIHHLEPWYIMNRENLIPQVLSVLHHHYQTSSSEKSNSYVKAK